MKFNKKINIPKLLFYSSTSFILFVYGVLVGGYGFFPYEYISSIKDDIISVYEERNILLHIKPEHHILPARYPGNGVTINKGVANQNEFLFLSGFFSNSNELRLIRRDGSTVKRWPVSFTKLFPHPNYLPEPPATDWNINIHGATALTDGSVVFNFEYAGLVKLDKCGRVVWTLRRSTHHSVERSENGGYWVPGRRFNITKGKKYFPPFNTTAAEDTILMVTENGKISKEISVPGLFYKNSLSALLTAVGYPFTSNINYGELVHLNKIAELKPDIAADFPLFAAGDLAISLRHFNMVLVVDPNTQHIKWWRIGPWIRQHDPEFAPGGSIVVFNNNVYEEKPENLENPKFKTPMYRTNIMEVNPITQEFKILYGGKKGQELYSDSQGEVILRPHGGFLITEPVGGRVFETDANGKIIWEYVNRYNKTEIARVTGAQIYPANYFTVSNWACGAPSNK